MSTKGLRMSVSNEEGRDFLLNYYTCRVTADGCRVSSAFVRFSDEDYHSGAAAKLTGDLLKGMKEACK